LLSRFLRLNRLGLYRTLSYALKGDRPEAVSDFRLGVWRDEIMRVPLTKVISFIGKILTATKVLPAWRTLSARFRSARTLK
jgi:hypothetical protein